MKKILFLFAITALTFTACKKDEGCMDKAASNYDSSAEKDDGSCKYEILSAPAEIVDRTYDNEVTSSNTTTTNTTTTTTTTTVPDTVTTIVKDTVVSKVKYGDGVTDVQGNTYSTVIIGSQEYMASNLKVTKLNDGTPITYEIDRENWYKTTSPAYAYLNNDASMAIAQDYGVLYNFYTIKTDKLCPVGFHVPTITELNALYDYLISQGHIGETATVLVNETYGFSGKFAGSIVQSSEYNQSNQTTVFEEGTGEFWSSTEGGGGSIKYVEGRSIGGPNNPKFFDTRYSLFEGHSVRCIKN